jgi:hypothetical protein
LAVEYVNAGAVESGVTVTSITPELPASIVAGNILLLIMSKYNTAAVSVPAGWTSLGEVLMETNGSGFAAYRFATGSDVDPTISWTGGAFATAQIYQYSGAVAVGDVASNGNNTATHSVGEIISTSTNSLAVYLDASRTSTPLTTPSGWTSNATATTDYGSTATGEKQLTTLGSSSGSISTAGGFGTAMYNVELLETLPPEPIDADAESTGDMGSVAAGQYAFSVSGSSTADADGDGSYIYELGASGTSSGLLSGIFVVNTEYNAVANSTLNALGASAVLSDLVAVGASSSVMADLAKAAHATFVVGTTGISIIGTGKANQSIDGSVTSEMTLAGSIAVLRHIHAEVTGAMLLDDSSQANAEYHLVAASLARLISAAEFINDYFDGYAYNLNTEAPSSYEQFRFNSFAQLGRDYYGMNEDGIHILTGDTDDGEDINAVMTTGLSDFDDSTLKTVPVIYASARSHKEMLLTARVDNYPDYSYTFIGKPAELAPVRVKLGRGLKGLNWQLELSNKDGAFIEIDALDVPTVSTSRKV